MNIVEELHSIGFEPSQGQNFLTSEPVIQALVEAGEVEGKTVLEIGAGTGAITEKIEGKAEKVYAVEKDTALFNFLDRKFEDSDNIELVNQDILNYDVPDVDRCVSNLPFEISSDILTLLGEKQIQSALILQKELAEKIIAEPESSEYSHFTVIINYYFIPVKLRDVSSSNFYPSPEVDTSIVKLYPNKERHDVENEDQFFNITKALFTHKRKKLRNAFVDARNILGITKDQAKEIRDDLPYSEERVNSLDLRKLAEITAYLSGKGEIS
jgi:16S rRNA (adenine1518-N6/adenine1519-N6)-dimethyltransferase